MLRRWAAGVGTLRPFLLGVVLGGLAVARLTMDRPAAPQVGQPESRPAAPPSGDWSPPEYLAYSGWHYLRVDDNGWSTGPVGSYRDLDARLDRQDPSVQEILIPVFPTVFVPTMDDKAYYNAILASDIRPGDKVLVVGTGSGADAWVAWLKSQSLIRVVELNPVAVVNARTTARIAGFPIRAVVGDITRVQLPEDFRDFDYVLWNMPFLEPAGGLEECLYHDGDTGPLLKAFLERLPSLLKRGGKAILLNTPHAAEYFRLPGATSRPDGSCTLYVVPNP